MTPLQVPLTHQKIWKDIPSYLDWIKLPQFRLQDLVKLREVMLLYLIILQKLINQLILRHIMLRGIGLPGDTINRKRKYFY